MSSSHAFTFYAPDKLMNLNDRLHWAAKARLVRTWRNQAGWSALQLPKECRPMPGPILVDVELPVTRTGRRDGHNYAPTVKAIIDGLVDAQVVPDDSTRWLATRDPTFVVGRMVTVTIRPLTL